MLAAAEIQTPVGRVAEQAAIPPRASFPVLRGSAGLFASLTFGQAGAWLEPVPDHVIAVGLIVGARPVGLALGTLLPGRAQAELLSVAVTPSERRRGLGRRLLEAWQAEARERGAVEWRTSYNASIPGREALEALLARAGWTGSHASGLVVVGRVGKMVDEVGTWPGVAGRLALPRSYSFEPLELGAADIEAVERYLSDPEAADMRGPIRQAERLALDFSIAIRRDGHLVGWLLAAETNRPLLDTTSNVPAIRYLEAYLDPAYRRGGIMVGAYYHCYSRQMALLGRDSIAIYYTSHDSRPRMAALTLRRFAPIAERVETILSASGRLPVPFLNMPPNRHSAFRMSDESHSDST
jgi:GNAT superfamily N-acetyltransferase